jgi:hypothetical protein
MIIRNNIKDQQIFSCWNEEECCYKLIAKLYHPSSVNCVNSL